MTSENGHGARPVCQALLSFRNRFTFNTKKRTIMRETALMSGAVIGLIEA